MSEAMLAASAAAWMESVVALGTPKAMFSRMVSEKRNVYLRYEANVAAENFEREFADRAAVNENGAARRIVDPGYKADERAFAGARRTDDGEAGAGGDGQRDIVEKPELRYRRT